MQTPTGLRRRIAWTGEQRVGNDHRLDVLELIDVPLRYSLQLCVPHRGRLMHFHALAGTLMTQIQLNMLKSTC